MMIEQLALANYRIAQLHVSARNASALEAIKLLNAAASRLLGEFRRTALALRAYRTRSDADVSATRLKIFKAAQ
jgi:hypothetical protein